MWTNERNPGSFRSWLRDSLAACKTLQFHFIRIYYIQKARTDSISRLMKLTRAVGLCILLQKIFNIGSFQQTEMQNFPWTESIFICISKLIWAQTAGCGCWRFAGVWHFWVASLKESFPRIWVKTSAPASEPGNSASEIGVQLHRHVLDVAHLRNTLLWIASNRRTLKQYLIPREFAIIYHSEGMFLFFCLAPFLSLTPNVFICCPRKACFSENGDVA